jgi:hypothetical protein
MNVLDSLYSRSLPAKRSGSLYSAFPYPTKISPEAIALFIAAHTKPGDTIFDGFAGSGTTGLAALLCENPPHELRQEAERLGLHVQWGARNAVLYELGALGSFVSHTLTNPPDPSEFGNAAEEILGAAESDEGWMYAAFDKKGRQGTMRYLIWSDLVRCPECKAEVKMWDACVSRKPAEIASHFTCPLCSHKTALDELDRLTKTTRDDLTGKKIRLKARVPVWLYGTTEKKTWSRAVTDEDRKLFKRIMREPIPDIVPRVEIPWGDLYRRGYHQGVTYLHHFYTRRNLIVFGRLWERTERYRKHLRDALRFWLLSYNASHATIMTRVVAKSGQKDLVVTSAQSGVLYISGLPVEKNLIAGLRRKLSTISKAFTVIRGRKGCVQVHQRSSCRVNLPERSVDYVFTDPPFGGNIPYAEISFLNEAWLHRYTDRREEVIVSNNQDKTLADYQKLLTTALSEVHRILKPKGKATLVFHSASAEVWNAFQTAYKAAGFSVECAGVLNKTQGSFKQVTTVGAVRGDPLLLLSKRSVNAERNIENVWTVAERLRQEASSDIDPIEQTAHRLYSRLVTHYLTHHQQVPLDADSFYRWYDEQPFLETTAGAGD